VRSGQLTNCNQRCNRVEKVELGVVIVSWRRGLRLTIYSNWYGEFYGFLCTMYVQKYQLEVMYLWVVTCCLSTESRPNCVRSCPMGKGTMNEKTEDLKSQISMNMKSSRVVGSQANN